MVWTRLQRLDDPVSLGKDENICLLLQDQPGSPPRMTEPRSVTACSTGSKYFGINISGSNPTERDILLPPTSPRSPTLYPYSSSRRGDWVSFFSNLSLSLANLRLGSYSRSAHIHISNLLYFVLCVSNSILASPSFHLIFYVFWSSLHLYSFLFKITIGCTHNYDCRRRANLLSLQILACWLVDCFN